MTSEWQPIKSAPKDGTVILGVAKDWMTLIWFQTKQGGGGDWIFADSDDFQTGKPTHWMNLPDWPKA